MRVYLTTDELNTPAGAQLSELCLKITADGRLDLEEIKELRQFLRDNRTNTRVAAISYLHEIMMRITADGVVDKDEQQELLSALKRVTPQPVRRPAVSAQKQQTMRAHRRPDISHTDVINGLRRVITSTGSVLLRLGQVVTVYLAAIGRWLQAAGHILYLIIVGIDRVVQFIKRLLHVSAVIFLVILVGSTALFFLFKGPGTALLVFIAGVLLYRYLARAGWFTRTTYLFFDTETSGLPKRRNVSPRHTNNWPHIVQIAWVICDEDGNVLEKQSRLIKPVGFEISAGAFRVHGISTEAAEAKGEPIGVVLRDFKEASEKAGVAVCHNVGFDGAVLEAEFIRLGQSTPLEQKIMRCTMEEATEYCQLQGGPYGAKWPKLSELHSILFGREFIGQHDAMADCMACMRCYFELKKIGAIE